MTENTKKIHNEETKITKTNEEGGGSPARGLMIGHIIV